ncbi:MAG TPA: hypothetical protein PLL30_17120 [Candidatus Krumholzibacteria bacterium]|nr:hypothetical protein [Candidatus Krumholzibacteria bacterium]HPD73497.1 hypothetical protein [Candidatus Krumholzibacteria bacterium]HRY42220.1 hypothetical protein [Candidatus Krumholzibacteria bacterium]
MANYSDNAVEAATLNDDYQLKVHGVGHVDAATLNDDTLNIISTQDVEVAVLDDSFFERNPTRVVDSAVLDDEAQIFSTLQNLAREVAKLNDVSRSLMTNAVSDSAVLNDAVMVRPTSLIVEAGVFSDLGDHAQAFTGLAAESGVLNDDTKANTSNKVVETGVINDLAGIAITIADRAHEVAILDDAVSAAAVKTILVVESGVLHDVTTQLLAGVNKVVEVGYLNDVAQGGAGVAWTVPSETMAMSRFSDYEFTSMAVVNGHLLGTSANGVFLLEGDTDAGALISAAIEQDWTDAILGQKGPEPDPNFKRPRYVYVNGRFSGALVFVLGYVDHGVEVEQDYSLPSTAASGFVNIRAPLGRGIRSRHLRPSIQNAGGADFEINDGRVVVDVLERSV